MLGGRHVLRQVYGLNSGPCPQNSGPSWPNVWAVIRRTWDIQPNMLTGFWLPFHNELQMQGLFEWGNRDWLCSEPIKLRLSDAASETRVTSLDPAIRNPIASIV